MIGELIDKIKDAENQASKIVSDAQKKAVQIENDAALEIQKIKDWEYDEIIKKTRKALNTQDLSAPEIEKPDITIEVDNIKVKQAKKLIIAEFNKRYTI